MCYIEVPYRSVYPVTMASSTKPANGNGTLGKRKKSRESRNSYLSKWLDRTMNHVQDATPSMDTYESYINANNWTPGGPLCPSIDPYRLGVYGLGQEPTSLPAVPTFFNPTSPPFYPDYRYIPNINKGIQVQRPRKRIPNGRAEDVSNPANGLFNSAYISKNYTDSQDFASLPPIVTSVGDTTSNSDLNMTEKEDGNRRFSDPCLRELTDVAQPTNGEGTGSGSDSELSGSHVGSKLLSCLVDQINTLKIANERLNKELHETKSKSEIKTF